MGRHTITFDPTPKVLRPNVRIEIRDAYWDNQIDASKLHPLRVAMGIGPYGSDGEMLHFNHAFSTFHPDESDRLLGAYAKIWVGDEVLWAGTFVGPQYQHEVNENGGVNQITMQLRDLWHPMSDQAVYSSFRGGYTVESLLRWLQGEPLWEQFSVPGSTPTQTTTTPMRPYVPYNRSNVPLVDIDVESFTNGTRAFLPRLFNNIETSRLITELAEEKNIPMVVIRPSGDPNKLGTVEAVRYSTTPKTLVFGGPTEKDFTTPSYVSRVTAIRGTMDHSGCVTQIRAIGGDITETIAVKLIPGWDTDLTNDVISDKKLIEEQPEIYGAVGKVWYVDINPGLNNIIPYSDVPQRRADSDDDRWIKSPTNTTEFCKVFEYTGKLDDQDEDKDDDSKWREVTAARHYVQYNREIAWTRNITFGSFSKLDWQLHNVALIVFEEPQLVYGTKISSNEITKDDSNRGEKTMILQGMRTTGRLILYTPSLGLYPRPRYRYVAMPEYGKHRASLYQGHDGQGYWNKRYRLEEEGRIDEDVERKRDDTLTMLKRALRMATVHSRPANRIEVSFSGIIRNLWFGDWIKTLISPYGDVLRDDLEWYVHNLDWDLENAETHISLGERTVG